MRKNIKTTEGIFPMPVLMVATYNEDGTVDCMNAAWGMMADMGKVALNLTETHKTVKNIKEKIKTLNIFPFAYKLILKTKNFEYRKFIIKNYIIIYKINIKEKEVNILHIYNQKQKIKNKKQYSQV